MVCGCDDSAELRFAAGMCRVTFCPQLVAGMLGTPIGRLADIHGRKRCWFAGCLIHLVAMCACGMAPNVEVLIAARAISGFGMALEGPSGGSIAMSCYPKERRGYVIAWLTICGTLSSSLGMVVGGFLLRVCVTPCLPLLVTGEFSAGSYCLLRLAR